MDFRHAAQALTRGLPPSPANRAPGAATPRAVTARRRIRRLAVAVLMPVLVSGAPAAPGVAALYDGPDGATCDYFNRGAYVAWRHRHGDWTDANGTPQGNLPVAQALVRPTDQGRVVRWDVTGLVRDWLDGRYANQGVAVFAVRDGDGAAVFHSREAIDPTLRPRLVATLANGDTRSLAPIADTTLACTTFTSLGLEPTLTAALDRKTLLQFDLAPLSGARVTHASLELTVAKPYGSVSLSVFRVDAPASDPSGDAKPRTGLAARYRGDRGIDKDADVLMATGFDTPAWRSQWSYVNPASAIETVEAAPGLGFRPLDGKALQVKIPAGHNLGLDVRYRFADKAGSEPDEIYFRYYLRLANDWLPADGGKLPGISATYGHAGWGGRKSDGKSGWSMRGQFAQTPGKDNPYHGLTAIGTYAYHAEMADYWGDPWYWPNALIERDRWYCIEQYVKLNAPGQRDGVLRAWVDGRSVFEKRDLRLRDVDPIRIQEVWMNVWFGGTTPTRSDLHLFIDNVVIARRYIGPMAR